jgi:hypothetical protein
MQGCAHSSSKTGLYKLANTGNTKGGSIIVPLTSNLTGLDLSVLQIKTKFVSCHTAFHLIVARQLSSGWRHNYSTKTRQSGWANEQSMYSLMSMMLMEQLTLKSVNNCLNASIFS